MTDIDDVLAKELMGFKRKPKHWSPTTRADDALAVLNKLRDHYLVTITATPYLTPDNQGGPAWYVELSSESKTVLVKGLTFERAICKAAVAALRKEDK